MEGEELELQPSARRTSSCGSAPRPTEEASRPNENHACTQTPGFHEVLKNCGFFYTGSEPIDSLLPAWNVNWSHDPCRLECDVEPSVWQELNLDPLCQKKFCRQRVTPRVELLPYSLHSRMNQGLRVMVDERIRFHLDTTGRKLLIKPLPRFLLDPRFWSGALFSDDNPDENERQRRVQLFEVALGLLFSYAGLIRHESDFHIAMENRLLPQDMTWLTWRNFITGLDMNCMYGKIHPWFCHDVMRRRANYSFLTMAKKLSSALPQILQALGGLAIYMTLVLAAFQTGLATEILGDDAMFNRLSFTLAQATLIYLAVFGVFLCWYALYFITGYSLYPPFDHPPVTKADPWHPTRLTSVEVGQGVTGSA